LVQHNFETINSIETKFEHRIEVKKKTLWPSWVVQRCLTIIQDGGKPPFFEFLTKLNYSAASRGTFMKFCRNIHSHDPKMVIWQKSTPGVNSRWRQPPFRKHVNRHISVALWNICIKFLWG